MHTAIITGQVNALSIKINARTFKPTNLSVLYIALLLLANASDIEFNPGPDFDLVSQSSDLSSVYLCGTCKEPVTWNDKGIMCEQCNTWYHTHCQNVHDSAYEQLGQSTAVWVCHQCHGPNYSSVLFDLHGVETSHPLNGDISSLSLNSLDSQELCGPSMHTSSPICPRASDGH